MWFKNILRPRARRSDARAKEARGSASGFAVDEALLRRLERLNLQAQRTLRGRPAGGEHPSRQQLPTTVFSDYRPYSPGDDYRYVDWNAYARQEQVVVKLGEAEQSIDVHMLLDCSRSMGWGAPAKLAAAQHLMAAIGYLALSHGDRVRVTPFGSSSLPTFGPAQGKSRLVELLRFVGQVQLQEQTALAKVLQSYPAHYPRGGLLVLCSDMLNGPAEGLAEGLRALPPPRWQVLVVHILDQREIQPDLLGPIELEDAETGQRLNLVLDNETVAAYRSTLQSWQGGLAEACAKRGATYAQIQTHWPLERAVVPYLRSRQVLR